MTDQCKVIARPSSTLEVHRCWGCSRRKGVTTWCQRIDDGVSIAVAATGREHAFVQRHRRDSVTQVASGNGSGGVQADGRACWIESPPRALRHTARAVACSAIGSGKATGIAPGKLIADILGERNPRRSHICAGRTTGLPRLARTARDRCAARGRKQQDRKNAAAKETRVDGAADSCSKKMHEFSLG